MKILRLQTKQAILQQLDKSILTRDAFECRFNEDEITLAIKFRDYEEYFFQLEERIQDHPWSVTERPGDTFSDQQTIDYATFEEAVERIDTWLEHILEELQLSSAENPRIFDDLRERLNEHADALPNPERCFRNPVLLSSHGGHRVFPTGRIRLEDEHTDGPDQAQKVQG